jgi:hypothetical protein
VLLTQQNFYLNLSPSEPFVSDKFVIFSNILFDGKLICMTVGRSLFFLAQFVESDIKVFFVEHSCMQPGLERDVYSSLLFSKDFRPSNH